ncbi:MAG TPA: RNA polymerase sigma-70 factor [Mucilaginibacter sp.]|nr:RNA polymerase sigma-70 factor [Mucilaginibacter sp.]
MELSELRLIDLAAEGSEMAFEKFFKTYFKSLHAYALVMLQDEIMAEEIVQQVFYRIWERKEQFRVHTSVKAFLYKAVYNECLNYLKHQKHKANHQNHVWYANRNSISNENAAMRVELSELETRLQKAMNELPEQCRTIFYMSRFDELKYREIANQMGLSIKTVEAQMGKALKALRKKLVDFLPILIWLIFKMK